MDTRANYALIGLFTLLVVAAGFLFVYWFAVSERGRERVAVEIVFRDSVAGLSRGSGVTFNGLRVGEVSRLRLDPEDPNRVIAMIQIDAMTPVRADTRAQLEYQGLTGIANVSLMGGSPDADRLASAPDAPPPVIHAEPSDFQDLVQSGRDIARSAAETLERLNKLIDENDDTISATIRNVENFSRALSDNAPGIDNFLEQVGQAAERVGPLADSLDELSRSTNAIVSAVDPDTVAATVRNVEQFTQTLADSREQIDQIFADAGAMTTRLNETSIKVEQTLDTVMAAVDAIDADRINATIANVESFSKMLADNNDNVTQVIANAASLTDNLNQTATRIDNAVEQVSALLDAVDREDLTTTLANVREFSTTLAENREAIDSIVRDAARIAGAIDPEQIGRMVGDAERFTAVLGARSEDTDRIISNVATLTQDLNATRGRVDSALEEINALVGAIDREQLALTLSNVSEFSTTLADNRGNVDEIMREAAALVRAIEPEKLTATLENVESFAQVLGARSADADQIIANALSISEKLNESADRIDGVLEAAQSFLGTAEDEAGEGLFDDIREAAVAIRTLADNLDTRTAEITAGISRFTGPGLQEYRSLADEGRRTLQDISRAVRAIERNPQQIIFGGQSSVPEFGGARR
jgi:phospholipid/cholesterol/gamma-HCH transport system substrate-binding protein